MKIFFRGRVASITQGETFVSVNLMPENGQAFFGEFVTSNKETDVLNIPAKLVYNNGSRLQAKHDDKNRQLNKWLKGFDEDCHIYCNNQSKYSWALFCQLWNNSIWIPSCPFCAGNDFETRRVGDSRSIAIAVTCNNCDCEGPTATTRNEAIELWNLRPKGR